jgi:type IV secretion system protein VirB9
MKARALALAIVLLPAPAVGRDARLTQRLYNADEVVRIDGRLGVQASIAFAEDEHIENVAVGDAESWQITPNKRADLLFVKPLNPAARTNMTVITDRHTYYFDLIASPRATPVYALRFTYPAEPRHASAAGASTAALTDAEKEALNGTQNPGEAPVDPAQLNFAWATKGPARLLPARLYDDGVSTYAVWGPGVPIPAILVTNDKGEEGPVNFAVRGETIVIDGVPSHLVLRAGHDRAELSYKGPGPRPRTPSRSAQPPAANPTAVAVPTTDQPRSE